MRIRARPALSSMTSPRARSTPPWAGNLAKAATAITRGARVEMTAYPFSLRTPLRSRSCSSLLSSHPVLDRVARLTGRDDDSNVSLY